MVSGGRSTMLRLVFSLFSLALVTATFQGPDPQVLRTYFKCPPCNPANCPLPADCQEMVREPGVCGCCLTCARQQGQPCGILTEQCASGLRCRPAFTDTSEQALDMLFRGKAICMPSKGTQGRPGRGGRRPEW